MLERIYDRLLTKYMKPGRVLVLYGPRRVGKTTLLENFLAKTGLKYRLDSGENVRISQILQSKDFEAIHEYAEGFDLIAIDEAQVIPNVGAGLKILVDQNPKVKVIATGSSSFELAHQIGEPLTGRKHTLTLFPVSQLELSNKLSPFELKEKLNLFLIYGAYPEVIMARSKQQKQMALQELVNSYLLKDILAFDRVKSPKQLLDLLRLLAFQIGAEVSLNELSTQLGIDVKTVGRYLDLLEKTFVIHSLGAFGRNRRKEVTGKKKYYFLDNGIRNTLILQFHDIPLRNDVGQLWENFIVVERLKKRSYKNIFAGSYFWRSYSQQEVDLIEEQNDKLTAHECKWSEKDKVRIPSEWARSYPTADFVSITPRNYLKFIA